MTRMLLAIGLMAATMTMAQDNSKRGPLDFPELEFANIPGAPKLKKPFLVMGSTGPVMAEKHGLSAPALWDWDNDGKRDLLIGEFETTSPGNNAENGSTVRVYINVGEDNHPKFTDDWYYARDNNGRPLEVDQWCCIGFTPQFVDLDDDGHLDIITGQYHPGDVTWFRGKRPWGPGKNDEAKEMGLFEPGRKLIQEGKPWSSLNEMHPGYKKAPHNETFDYWVYSSANFGDLDGDGDLDLITGGKYLRVSENIGDKKNPRFGPRVELKQTDGQNLITRVASKEEIKQYESWGYKYEPKGTGSGKSQQHVVDWDGDGVLDILSTDEYLTSSYSAVTFFKGVKVPGAMQKFEPGISLFDAKDGSKAFPGSGQRVYVDDWNKDGVNDLIIGASIVTVDGKFHGKMSWEYEGELGIESAGKDYGRYPDQFNIPTFDEYAKNSPWVADQPEKKQRESYEMQMSYIRKELKNFEDKGIPDAPKMIHKGYIYVFLGEK